MSKKKKKKDKNTMCPFACEKHALFSIAKTKLEEQIKCIFNKIYSNFVLAIEKIMCFSHEIDT
jgi:hypothetical protein